MKIVNYGKLKKSSDIYVLLIYATIKQARGSEKLKLFNLVLFMSCL